MIARIESEPLSIERWRRWGGEALDRLEQTIARDEPRIRALLPEPGRFDRLRRASPDCPDGPLEGIPVGIKDIFHVDGFETRAGSRLPATMLAGPQSTAVERLLRAGALILGKTVTTEFAYFAPGPTRNPRDLAHTPGGSSSGSAAAVAAGFTPMALGTQTIGSICRPASYCGVVGFKPTYGRIPTAGVIPLAPSLDHIGLFTNTVADAELAASILCDGWRTPNALSTRPRLAVPRGPFLDRAAAGTLDHFEQTCAALQAAGWQVEPVAALADLAAVEARNRSILAAEVARVHRDWYGRFAELYRPQTASLIEEGLALADDDLEAARTEQRRFAERLAQQMETIGIDLWITPAATGPAPAGLDSTGDPIMSLPWTQAGLPALSLPSAPSPGDLPIGLQLIGRPHADENLLGWCHDIESVLTARS